MTQQLVIPVDEQSIACDRLGVERWAALYGYVLANVRRIPDGEYVVLDGELHIEGTDPVYRHWIGDIVCAEVDIRFEWIPPLTIHNFGTEDSEDWACWRNKEDVEE